MRITLSGLKQICQQRTDALLALYLNEKDPQAIALQEAMAYAVFSGGKRLRSLLIYATGEALDVPLTNLDLPAAAMELIHAYSLVHDDLPAMDNAELRRGKPTCHKMYGEAIAILAGDALQTLAFDILSSHPAEHLNATQRLAMIQTLCKASGLQGMVAGQVLDIQGANSLPALTNMYQLKTGALLASCIKLAIIAANTTDPTIVSALENFAHSIGAAYQLQDDLLDIEGNSAVIGKTQGIDFANQKTTYAALIGVQQTKQNIKDLFDSAHAAIQLLGNKKSVLAELADAMMLRNK